MNRREFLQATAVGAAIGCSITRPRSAATEPPPETTTVRIIDVGAGCLAPQMVADDLLKADGFTAVEYVKIKGIVGGGNKTLSEGGADFLMNDALSFVLDADAGMALVVLGGVHTGCYELFGTDRVRSVKDLKGKAVALPNLGKSRQAFVASILKNVGLDPQKDVQWVVHPPVEAMRLLAEGTVAGWMGFPPEPQELRAKKVGHVLVDTKSDRPWSQYFCCMIGGNREFVRKHPIATKKVVRAILKASELCATEPERIARLMVDRGYASHYEYVVQMLKEVRYGRWRDYNPEETMRFYALRLHEVGFIKASPQKIIAQSTDWRFINELKKELKG
jgi:NitT/TauT family transport system substrate-binding protein